MKFIDEIEVLIKAGNGGDGSVHFCRKKFMPRGGPDGGDGGRGGDVYLIADSRLQSLGHLRKSGNYEAQSGGNGRGDKCSGAAGEDLYIPVPVGTQIEEIESGKVIGDMTQPDKTLLVARGGKGGFGNIHFATSVRQAPDFAKPGLPGQTARIRLNLKLFADVGLVGLPNAGKSTLLSALSRKESKIADYPFTTLTPNIGVVEADDYRRLLLADIPGIIEGASRGTGLGLSFLRHIERVQLIVYVIDIGSPDAASELSMLKNELASYSEKLLELPVIVTLNKSDLISYDNELEEQIIERININEIMGKSGSQIKVHCISSLEKHGLDTLKKSMFSFFPGRTLAESYTKKTALPISSDS